MRKGTKASATPHVRLSCTDCPFAGATTSNHLEYIRRNGQFFLNVVGRSRYGLPYGQDRLIPIWVAPLAVLHQSRTIHFNSAAEVLRTFDLPLDGKAIAGSWTAQVLAR